MSWWVISFFCFHLGFGFGFRGLGVSDSLAYLALGTPSRGRPFMISPDYVMGMMSAMSILNG
jgi:hypothetical protein